MKKVLIAIFLISWGAGVAFAADYADVLGNEHDRIWKEMRDNQHRLAVGGTLTNGLTISGAALAVNSDSITCDGNLTITPAGGTLAIVGAVTVSGAVEVTGGVEYSGNFGIGGTFTATSTNDATTNVLVTVDAEIDGEYIADDTIDDDSIDLSTGAGLSASDMPNEDLGDISVSGGSWTLDADVVAAAEMADADHGDVSWSSGVATVDNVAAANISGNIAIARITNALIDAVGANQMADEDHGDITWASGVASVDDNSLGMTDIAAADYGDISVGADGTVTVDSGAVLGSELGAGNIGIASISNALAAPTAIGGGTPAAGSFTSLSASGDLTVTGGDITGANGSAIDMTELLDGTFIFSITNNSGTVYLTSYDDNNNCDMVVGAGGNGSLTLGFVPYTGNSNASITLITDGTGDGEVTVPEGAISSTEITDDTLVNADVNTAADIASSKLAQDVVRIGDTSNTNQLFQSGSETMHAGTVWTQTFETAYCDGATPIVVANYTENPGDVQPMYVTSVASNQFTLTVTADKNFNWMAIGQKP